MQEKNPKVSTPSSSITSVWLVQRLAINGPGNFHRGSNQMLDVMSWGFLLYTGTEVWIKRTPSDGMHLNQNNNLAALCVYYVYICIENERWLSGLEVWKTEGSTWFSHARLAISSPFLPQPPQKAGSCSKYSGRLKERRLKKKCICKDKRFTLSYADILGLASIKM